MKSLLFSLVLLFVLPASGNAQFINEFTWKSRVLVVFTPSPNDPMFVRQMSLINEAQEEFAKRDVVILMVTPEGKHENTSLFLDEAASRRYYEFFGAEQYQMEIALVGYDGKEKLRLRNRITPPSVILTAIDDMPLGANSHLRGRSNKSQIESEDSRVVKKRRDF